MSVTGATESRTFRITFRGRELEISAKLKGSSNELILFIHGLGCSKESFDAAFDFPGLADFRLLAVDLVGYGDSSRPDDFSYTMEDQAQVLRLLLDEMEPARVHIVAHSMGGAVGLLLADAIAGRLASFVNVEGNLIGSDCGLISRKAIQIPYEEFRDNMFGGIIGVGPEQWREMSAKADVLGFYKSCESLVEWSDTEKLLEIFLGLEADRLYIHGDRNSDMEILGRLGEIRKASVCESGHFVMNDNPAEFCSLVCETTAGRTG
jgi:pimeloyl-ACP methyl ester carboxylesterase